MQRRRLRIDRLAPPFGQAASERRMAFSVSATSRVGAIFGGRSTLEEAIALAMDYRKWGYSEIKIRDLASREILHEERIVAIARQFERLQASA
jgi:hypothetical protein